MSMKLFYLTALLILLQQQWIPQGSSQAITQQLRVVPNTQQMSRMSEAEKQTADDSRVSYILQKLPSRRDPAADGRNQLYPTASSSTTSMLPGLPLGTANYLINVALGSPPENMSWIIDTASDLSWTQCLPCNSCYPQRDAIFDPSASSTYVNFLCKDFQNCNVTLGPYRDRSCDTAAAGSLCKYKQPYLDGTVSAGDFATDVISIPGAAAPSPIRFSFGCGHSNVGKNFIGYSGILTLSRDILSFIYQANITSFSYCLPDPYVSVSARGFLEFNPTTQKLAASVCFDLLYVKHTSIYVANVSSVAVNNVTIRGTPSFMMIIDSGTLISRLPPSVYFPLRDAFLKHPATARLTGAANVSGYDACFNQNSVAALGLSRLPSVTFSFSGAKPSRPYKVPATGILYRRTDSTSCFAFRAGSNNSPAILGNFQQHGRRFTFDTKKSMGCVEPTGTSCS